jgi:hypothetical protein
MNETWLRDSQMCRLYLLELLKFIQISGEYKNIQISKISISEALNLVNKHRNDAHAKDIDDSDEAYPVDSGDLHNSPGERFGRY